MEKNLFPLHPSQNGIYLDQMMDAKSVHYTLGVLNILKGQVDIAALKKAVHSAVLSFDATRLSFTEDHAGVVKCYSKPIGEIEIKEIDFSSAASPSENADAWIKSSMRIPFDIYNDRLFEIAILKLSGEEHYLFLRFHHLISDGAGISIFNKYVSEKYNSIIEGREIDMVTTTYRSCVEDYFNSFDVKLFEQDKQYWLGQFSEQHYESLTPRFNYSGNKSGTIVVKPDALILEKCGSLIEKYKINFAQLTIAALNVFYYKSLGWQNVVYGLTSHNRRNSRERTVFGSFAQVFPFVNKLDESIITVQELFDTIKAKQRTNYRHLNYPIDQLNRDLKIFSKNKSQLFDIAISYNLIASNLFIKDTISTTYDVSTDEQPYPIHFWWRDYGKKQDIELRIDYLLKYFTEEDAWLIVKRIFYIIEQFDSASDKRIEDINILPAEEKKLLLFGFNNTQTIYPDNKTIVELFNEQAMKTPDAVAFVAEEKQLTYKEVHERSTRLAVYLNHCGISGESLVPICIERGLEMIIGILGIWKAGGAYVPVDTEFPVDRINYLIKDIDCRLVVCCSKTVSLFANTEVSKISLDDDWHKIEVFSKSDALPAIEAGQLAYIIYTSGSTGQPKGVQIEHRGMLNHLFAKVNELCMNNQSRMAFTASYTFDISIWQMFSATLCGGQTFIYNKNAILDTEILMDSLAKDKITIAELVPSYLATILERPLMQKLDQLRYLLVTGETLQAALVNKWYEIYGSGTTLVNAYGPTEASDDICHCFLEPPVRNLSVPIGKPVQNMNIFIIDKMGNLCPIGVKGELCVSGVGLSRGYLNKPALTNEKFIMNPFSKSGTERLYRTGDLACWLSDGNIEFSGRFDDQIKIRGYRIELGEIEQAVLNSGLVHQVVVLAKGDVHKRLVSYVVPAARYKREQLIEKLKKNLPEYMVPAVTVELDVLPLTTNGKIDKKALPDAGLDELPADDYLAPSSGLEQTLAGIWQDLLKVKKIGANDNFFELGGDSIMVIQMVSRMKRLGYQVKPIDVFNHPQISELSSFINSAQINGPGDFAEKGLLSGKAPLLPVQHWYLNFAEKSAIDHFNQSVLLKISKQINASTLISLAEVLIKHHDGLRFSYTPADDGWQQLYQEEAGVNFEQEDLSAVGQNELAAMLNERDKLYQRGLKIREGKVIRFVLFVTGEGEAYNRLLIIAHHLVIDGVSWRILIEDMRSLLENAGKTDPVLQEWLGQKTASYRQWGNALQAYSSEERLLCQKDYWLSIINSYTPISVDRNQGLIAKVSDCLVLSRSLEQQTTQKLLTEVSGAYNAKIDDILLSALSAAVLNWRGHKQLSVGLEGHGREHLINETDISHTTGWFTTLYPVILKCAGSEGGNYSDSIRDVKEQLRKIPDGGIGYGVLKYLNAEPGLTSAQDPWCILFNYLGRFDEMYEDNQESKAGLSLFLDKDYLGNMVGGAHRAGSKLTFNIFVSHGQLTINLTYSNLHFEKSSVEELMRLYMLELVNIVDHCAAARPAYGTPSDYMLGDLVSLKELDVFMLEELPDGRKRYEVTEDIYPLSSLQEGMLFHSLLEGADTGGYIQQQEVDLKAVDPSLLQQSWQYLLDRHTILRSGFYTDRFKIPVQCVYKTALVPFDVVNYSAQQADEQLAAINDYWRSVKKQGFDFGQPPLISLRLVQLAADRYKLLWAHHHILLDGWSVPLIITELLLTYEQLANGMVLDAPTQDLFKEYVTYVGKRNRNNEKAYWKHYLSELNAPTLLPFIETTQQRNRGGEYSTEELTLNQTLSEKTRTYAKNNRITINTILQGVWSYLLHQYTSAEDIVYGVTVSGRPADLPGIEHKVGMYLNTQPLRSKITHQNSIAGWLRDLQDTHQQSQEFQYTPLTEVQQYSGIKGDWFDSLLVYENYPVDWDIMNKGWKLKITGIKVEEHTNYALTIVVHASETRLDIRFSYNMGLLQQKMVGRISDHFKDVLSCIVCEEAAEIRELPILSFDERSLHYAQQNELASFWKEYLAGYENAAMLPQQAGHLMKTAARQYQSQHYLINTSLQQKLYVLCQETDVSVDTIFKCAWAVLLSKYNHTEDIVFVGAEMPDADQSGTAPASEKITLNPLPVRICFDNNDTFSDLLKSTGAKELNKTQFENHSFAEIKKLVGDDSDTPNHLLIFAKTLKITSPNQFCFTGDSVYDLYIAINSDSLDFTFDPDRYTTEMISDFAGNFLNILVSVAANAEQKVKTVVTFNRDTAYLNEENFSISLYAYEPVLTIQEKLNKSFAVNKNECAIEYNGNKFTYGEIEEKVNNIFNAITKAGIPEQSYIGIFCEDRCLVICSILAILKSRNIFVPLEVSLPATRLCSMIDQVDIACIITDQCDHAFLSSDLQDKENMTWIYPHISVDSLGSTDTYKYNVEDNIYVYFTSGSTGIPKAVVGRNKGLSHFVEWEIQTFNINRSFKFSQFTNPGFDVFMRDTIVPLCAGASICIPDESDLLTGEKVCEWIDAKSINLIHCVPSFFKYFKSKANSLQFSSLRYILLAGEKIMPFELEDWYAAFESKIQLVNIYGPTETTLAKGCYFIQPADRLRNFIPIKPIPGAQFLILDKEMNLCPRYAIGEIYVRTPYRAAGYLKDKKPDGATYIKNHFSQQANDLIYKTGDLGRLNEHCEIEILGRIDQQIKIRGIRIELDDIRQNILKFPGVEDAVLIVKKNEELENQIYAYVVGTLTPGLAELRTYLETALPRNMVPSYLIALDKIPLLPNGKINRKALPEAPVTADTNTEESLDATEERLLNVWADVLKVDKSKLPVNNSFFEAGGHSLKVFHLINEIQHVFHVKLKLGDVFQNPSIKKLASLLAGMEANNADHIPRAANKEYYTASPAQERMFYQHELHQESTAFNISFPFEVDENISAEQIRHVFEELIKRHESLRTGFILQDEGVVQKVYENVPFELKSVNMSSGNIKQSLQDFIQPFDLAKPPLFRCGLTKDEKGRNILFLDIHHIIADGASLEILVNDFMLINHGKALPVLPVRYVDYAQWIQDGKGKLELQKKYWVDKLAGQLPRIDLPVNGNRMNVSFHICSTQTLIIEGDLYNRIRAMNNIFNVSDFMILLSVYYIMLSRISGSGDIIIGTDVIGRTHKDIKNLVGTFVNILPLRIELDQSAAYSDFLLDVKKAVLDAYENQDVQFDQMVSMIAGDNSVFENPIVEVHFSYVAIDEKKEIALQSGLNFIQLEKNDNVVSQYEFKLEAISTGNRIEIAFIYNNGLYETETIALFTEYYRNILSAVLQNQAIPVGTIDMDVSVESYMG
ncbi:MAG: amino acid adenylation domain-containing protein [Ferruginibacter sp.]|nr:amino acid adenylation domain-containing protein [Ferruginibacter sp.]